MNWKWEEIKEEVLYAVGLYGEKLAIVGLLLILLWDILMIYARMEYEPSLRGKGIIVWLLLCGLGWLGARTRDKY